MKIKREIGAKLNLTLDILGEKDGFHLIKSLVTEISLKDTISISKRKDDKITLKIKGADLPTDERNNAYRTAKLFMEKFNTFGVDITIKKGIPLGGGLGGSSADIAGVLLIMKELFNIECDLKELSSLLGSDVYYMTKGGFAVIEGKGEEITPLPKGKKLYFLLAVEEKGCLAKDCYKKYDELGERLSECTTSATEYLEEGNTAGLLSVMKNDLLSPAIALVPEIRENLSKLSVCGNAFMTGSGSVTFSVFDDKKERDFYYNKLKKQLNLVKAETVN